MREASTPSTCSPYYLFFVKKSQDKVPRFKKKSFLFCLGNLVCRHDDDDVNDDDDKEEYDQVMDDEDV